MDQDDIGEIGQDAFKLWCSQAGLVAIPASRDKKGWDFLVQVPAPGGRHDAEERTCKAQVKTTTTSDPSASIKMSNWRRMALERVPWFVVHIVLEGSEVKSVYVVHVDKELVAKVIERLGQFGEGEELHKREMSIRPNEVHRLELPLQEGLPAALAGHLGTSEEAYVLEKSAWVKECGYEERPFGVSFDIAGGEGADTTALFADWIVGLIPELPISAMRVVETRFGIESVLKDAKEIEGYAKLGTVPSLGVSTITLKTADNSDRVVLSADFRSAKRFLPWLPDKYERVYLVGKSVSFLCKRQGDGAVFKTMFSIAGSGHITPLLELASACKAIRLIAASDKRPLEARIAFPNGGSFKMPIGTSFEIEDAFERFIRVVEWAAAIARYFDIQNDVELDPEELLQNEFQVAMLAAGFDRSIVDFHLKVRTEAGETCHGKRAAIIVGAALPLANTVVAAVFAIVGSARWSDEGGGTVGIDGQDVRVASKLVVAHADWKHEMIDEKLKDAESALLAEGVEVVLAPGASKRRADHACHEGGPSSDVPRNSPRATVSE